MPVSANSIKSKHERDQHGDTVSSRRRVLEAYGEDELTDRQVLARVHPDREDMNLVRPTITDLIDEGEIEWLRNDLCEVTGKTVRVTRRPLQKLQPRCSLTVSLTIPVEDAFDLARAEVRVEKKIELLQQQLQRIIGTEEIPKYSLRAKGRPKG